MKLLRLFLVVALFAGGCRFRYDNPAEKLLPGEVRGKAVLQREGENTWDPAAGTRARLRGAPFALEVRPSGYFAFLDLPVGRHTFLFDYGSGDELRSVTRQVEIALGSDGQPEGVNLGEVRMLYTASVSGRVVDLTNGNPVGGALVVDDVSLLTTVSDAEGQFTLKGLAVGRHTLRAAGHRLLGAGESRALVGGVLEVNLTPEHSRLTVAMPEPLELREAQGRKGRVRMTVALMTPGRPPFGLGEIKVVATRPDGSQETLASPSSKGEVDDPEVPEGVYRLSLHPPDDGSAAEFVLVSRLDDVIVLEDAEVDLGTVVLASASSISKSRGGCAADQDCHGGGRCQQNVCAGGEPEPDPCAVDNGGCGPFAECRSTEGLLECDCLPGFERDGRSCREVNECARGLHDCHALANCIDLSPLTSGTSSGGFRCECRSGYDGDGRNACVNINECAAVPSPCHPDANCLDLEGRFACECKDGFSGNGVTCSDVLECDLGLHDCDANADCVEKAGSYACLCRDGYDGDGTSCSNVNECQAALPPCDPGAYLQCVDSEGSFDCVCEDGFVDDGLGGCADVDECTEGLLTCSAAQNEVCLNLTGSAYCTCAEGFARDTSGGATGACVNVDECALQLDTCSSEVMRVCVDTVGAYRCDCAPGYAEDETGTCANINECAGELLVCDPNATCVDEPGTYACICDEGFRGDGVTCGPAFVRFSLGYAHSCGIKSDGSLWCWGNGPYGETGHPVPGAKPAPVRVGDDRTWTQVSAGPWSTCALDGEGHLFCWGQNVDGMLGLGEDGPGYVLQPEQVGSEQYSSVEVGGSHACAIRALDQSLWCWGSNWSGQLGLGETSATEFTPVRVPGELRWSSVAAGSAHTCAVTTEQQLYCWGSNNNSETGIPGWYEYAEPLLVDESKTWLAVAAGPAHTCALEETDAGAESGRLWCWGYNVRGEAGQEETEIVTLPAPVGAESWKAVSLGESSCGLRSDDTVWCWGRNEQGQLGDGTRLSSAQPLRVASSQKFRALAVGQNHACAVEFGGNTACWGSNTGSQLGIGVGHIGAEPMPVGADRGWTDLSSGARRSCAILDGGLWCWGELQSGQDLPLPGAHEPVMVGEENDWRRVVVAASHACALRGDDSLWCWGNASGFSDLLYYWVRDPAPVVGSMAWRDIAAGGNRTCGIEVAEAGLWCAGGSGGYGLIDGGRSETIGGLGGTLRGDGEEPVFETGWSALGLFTGESSWSGVSVGGSHLCAIAEDQSLWCFLDNLMGQLGGEPDPEDPESAVEVHLGQAGPAWVAVSAGGHHTCALRAGGDLYCWGANYSGQLGQGDLNSRSAPTLVPAPDGIPWESVSAGPAHTCAVQSDGSAWCWGEGISGELGSNDPSSSVLPVRVLFDEWNLLRAGGEIPYVGRSTGEGPYTSPGSQHTCGLKRDGTLWCWGGNTFGQRGDGTASSAVPIPIREG